MIPNLTGQVAIVTGASRGIGLATARKLAGLGAHVLLAARSEAAVESAAAALSEQGPHCLGVACDVTRYDDVAATVERAVSAFGRLDILVNNAGTIDPIARLEDSDPAQWGIAIDVNVKGVYHGLRAALPVMREQGSGTIVNLSSGAATSALEGWSHYCASKAAAKRLTECAHLESAAAGVRIVGISPGTVATEMMSTIRDSGVNPVSQLDWSTHIPPEWVAEAIAFLAGDGGAAFAGQDFTLKTREGRRLVGLPEDGAPDG